MVPCRLAGEQDAIAFGRHLGSRLVPGSVVALVGGLGAGKTHVAKGIAAALGYSGEVTSPTFTLVHEYADPSMACPVYHFDFYRLRTPDEVLGLGWDEYLEAGGICVVEWADLFPELLPPDAQWWRLSIAEEGARDVEAIAPPFVQSVPPAISPDPTPAP